MQNCQRLLTFAVKCNQRGISTAATLFGKRNFRKFLVYNKRGTRVVKEQQNTMASPPVAIHKRGVRDTGLTSADGKYVEVPEKIPELIVPDLTNCQLRPYVSYKSPEVIQSEFTSLDLFNAVYSQKIIEDFKDDKLNLDGSSTEPSQKEQMTSEEALLRARKTGTDLF